MKRIVYLIIVNCIFWSASTFAQKKSSCWQITNINHQHFILDLTIQNKRFKGSTRKAVLPQLLGIGKYHLGVLFKKIPKQIVLVEGTVRQEGDTLYLSGNYTSYWSKQRFEAKLIGDSLIGKTIYEAKDGKSYTYLLKGGRKQIAAPARDYVAIAKNAISITEENLFLPNIATRKEWQKFKQRILRLAPQIRDDYEFWICYNYGVSALPFSHYGIQFNKVIRPSKSEEMIKPQYVTYTIKDSTTGLLTVRSFSGDGGEMRRCIDQIKTHHPKNLLIDLRNNGGGSIQAAMPLARFLTQDTLYGGVFLTQKWFKNHDALPKVEDYKHLTHFSAASYALILEGIHHEEGLCLRIDPDTPTFDGAIYVLTNNRTASTCEPFVYSLQYNKAAIIVGEKTAGQMLNGEAFAISSNFKLFLPTADFYAVDGYKIDQNGVLPDVPIDSEEALDYVLEHLLKTGYSLKQ